MVFSIFVAFCAGYTFYYAFRQSNTQPKVLNHDRLKYNWRTVVTLIVLSLVGGILVGVIGADLNFA